MSEGTETSSLNGRTVSVLAYGKTADELELDALDKAREFFGPEVRLQVVRNYSVTASGSRPGFMMAGVTVREIGE